MKPPITGFTKMPPKFQRSKANAVRHILKANPSVMW
jgi:hypothetical protein